MQIVTVSPKFQVVIPRAIREALDIQVGQKLQTLQYGQRIELVPVRDIASARGLVPGLDTRVDRERDREDEDAAGSSGRK